MRRRTLKEYAAAALALGVLGGLYLAAWVVSWDAFNRPRPLQMRKR
jgi:hypothetical protein